MYRTFDSFSVGDAISLGTYDVTREEIIEFASEFDAQPFHLDDEAGKASMLGGLAASGWHTCSMFMRMLADGLLKNSNCQGSPGVEQLRWLYPVYPDDTLSAEAEVLSSRLLESNPHLGLVTFHFVIRNQNKKPVAELTNSILFRRGAEQ
ncbi:MaoC family dehydratase [Coralliovum pocilloporae]|uniref:MaoC family dehydratase n=1 Tax=Coralliovum pocilloporae TaxID=3066369 RepID=UPI003307323D